MSTEGTAPCPHCKAENMAHRRICWRCKRTLPTSFALDAALRMSALRTAAAAPTPEEIEDALRQAVIIGDDENDEAALDESSGFRKRLLWLLGKRTHA